MKKIFFILFALIFIVSCEDKTEITVFEKSTITDVEGNEYATIKIGNQWWMAENLKCATYDTESRLSGTTIGLSTAAVVFTPYHTRILATTNSISSGINQSVNLTSEHRSHIGNLYNWAAALGLKDGQVDTVFVEKQQGICPNGWHIPSDEEWTALTDYISKHGNGKYKTTTGWFDKNQPSEADAPFAVLPAGYAQARVVKSLGFSSSFITATSADIRSAVSRYVTYNDDIVEKLNEVKSYANSVRCVKNN